MSMKMIIAIVNKEDSNSVSSALTKASYRVTKLPTTGGFLMAGNMTLLIGLPDERVDECIKVIGDHCKQRTEVVPSSAGFGVGMEHTYPVEVTVGGATVFVTNVERFEKL